VVTLHNPRPVLYKQPENFKILVNVDIVGVRGVW